MKEDFSAFDKGVQEYDTSAFDKGIQEYDLTKNQANLSEPDTLDDFLTGAIQGATFGFSDEIGAAIDILRGKAPADAKTMMEAFRVLQKAREGEIEKAKERSPMAVLSGELVGGFAVPIPGALSAGAGKALKITPALQKLGFGEKLAEHVGSGTAVGGLAGLGTSRGTLEGSPGEVLGDVGIGGAFGGALGGVLGTAFDKLKAAKEAAMKKTSVKQSLSAMEGGAGEIKGLEGESLVTGESPSFVPGEPEIASQKFRGIIDQDVDKIAEKALERQKQAKEQLSKAISDNFDTPAIPENAPDSLVLGLERYGSDEVRTEAIKELYIKHFPQSVKDEIEKAISEGKKIDVNKYLSEFLDPQNNRDISDAFGDIYNRKFTKLTLEVLKEASDQLKDPKFTTYAESLSHLMRIADATNSSNPALVPIRRAMELIDRNFYWKIKQDPFAIKIGDLYNFRQNFLQRAKDKALDLDLDFAQRELLFGKRNPATGKYEGGVFDSIENIMKNSSTNLKASIDNVDLNSRHIETLLNEHPDPNFHGLKAWDFNDKDLRLELRNILLDKAVKSRSAGEQKNQAANLLRKYFNILLENEPNVDRQKEILADSKKLEERADQLASIIAREGIDTTAAPKTGSFDPRKAASAVQESNVPKLFENLGRMKKSAKETIEEIPSPVRKAVSLPFTAPFKFKNATEEQLKKAAQILKGSDSAAVRQFGEGMEESAMNNPAVRNALIHSAFQRADIRRALGLSLNDDDKEKK